MNYCIREKEAFSVIGQKVLLTNRQTRNIQISTQFWRTFNTNLKKAYLSQSGNWIKYAFMERRDDKLFYYCAIPGKSIIPDGFTAKNIPAFRYLVVEHVGAMSKIYDTYWGIYRELLPSTGFRPLTDDFIHFEQYDEKFHWNQENSIIEIWVPIKVE